MDISGLGGGSFKITGEIKTISDYQSIKKTIQEAVDGGASTISIAIEDAQTITSSVVGYLLKLVNLNNVNVTLSAKNNKLYKMLEDLVLIDVFNVTQG